MTISVIITSNLYLVERKEDFGKAQKGASMKEVTLCLKQK